MSQFIHQFAFYIHVAAGSLALIVFWLPMFAKKGSPKHVKFGRYFTRGMYTVAVSGFIMTGLVLIDPIGVRAPGQPLSLEEAINLANSNRISAGFLMMLSFLVFNSVRQGILVLEAKANRSLLKTPLHLGMYFAQGLTAILMGYLGIAREILLFQIFSVLCLIDMASSFHYIFKKVLKPREWIITHLGSIIAAGIGAYTAFFAFGGRRILSQLPFVSNPLVFWILPGIIGTVAIIGLSRKYSRQYRVV